ncbi:PREDICTED: 7-deoxyloganetic acid glucosyltransferase-like [Ipomoea nil]|uniref:7-deoxyloganetic acid glucosyltransferase-like n=1 Tax=Ipomoea nil TaxID=35883 RepID=UPI0009013B92|nr:PREDICTED: 7-deoxyloganetic acid glucosyltransferase-like [Ipomoea nil]
METQPHVLIFPLPLQGPVNCMLNLAEILCVHGDIHVTFLNTDHVHRRLLSYTDVEERFRRYPNFRFETLPDGMPEDSPRTGEQIVEMIQCIEKVTCPLFREMVTAGGSASEKPVSCLIVDGIFPFAVDIAKEIGVPLFYFDTISPCAVWIYLRVPKLIEAGELPFQGDDLDAPVSCVPGMENILRRRDLPSFCQSKQILEDPIIQIVLNEAQYLPKAHGLIFNTFSDIDDPILQQFRSISPNVYAVGPLHAHRKARIDSELLKTSNSIWKEDWSCMEWLNKQPQKSVLYVSIGSLAVISEHQFMELWHGLVKSGVRFLWVQRPGSIIRPSGSDSPNSKVSIELSRGTDERGCIVSWAPQERVLAHPSVAGFLTHSGWNSTLESIVEGVPMICWPYFVDQQVNSRYVGEVWKIGLDMKDLCSQDVVERMVREVMDDRKDEFLERSKKMANLAKQSVMEGGDSYQDMERLINDIRRMRI